MPERGTHPKMRWSKIAATGKSENLSNGDFATLLTSPEEPNGILPGLGLAV